MSEERLAPASIALPDELLLFAAVSVLDKAGKKCSTLCFSLLGGGGGVRSLISLSGPLSLPLSDISHV